MHPLVARALSSLAIVGLAGVLVAACAAGASPSESAGPTPSGLPSSSPSGPSSGPVTTPEQAVARIVAAHPEFERIPPFDPDLIGGCCWYRASAVEDGYEVVFRMGWGDCPSGCIDEHLWTYRVGSDGSVELIAESGDLVPPGGIPGDEGS